jgi:mannose-6-phosphate isomerase
LKESRRTFSEESRPWGGFSVIEDLPTHKVKRIWVHPGKRLSYQRHLRRFEHWVILEGRARVTLEAAHRIENIGEARLTFIEVQLGDYFGEDDIVRLEDDYGRVPKG